MSLFSPSTMMDEAEQFSKYITEALVEVKSTPFQQPHPKIFKDEFLAVPLPAKAVFSLTDFTGPQEKPTIIITRYIPQATNESTDLDQSELSNENAQEAIATQSNSNSLPSLGCLKVVNIGQQLLQKRSYLSDSFPFHAGLASEAIQCFHSADISELVPLSLDKARYLASLYSLSSKSSSSLPNLWILCTSEKQRIVSLGSSFDDTHSLLYTYTIRSEDPVKNPSDNVRKGAGGIKQTDAMSGSVFSEYSIAGLSESDNQGSGSLVVQFCWSGAEKALCLPPESADAVVRVSANPGYIFSPVLATYHELSTLLNLCKIAADVCKWPSQEHSPDGPGISEKIESFLEEVASPLSQPLDATVISPTADNTIYETRKDLDFAERLWVFAKDVNNLYELQKIFAAVFKALLLGRVQPFVHRSSSSTLAMLLRQLLQSTSTEERQSLAPKYQTLLSHSKLLPCLIQIGLEKMRRDYRAFFVGSDIANDQQLDDFFSASALHSQLAQCQTLCKIHNVLEINASALSFLNLPTSALSSLTKVALDVYKEITFETFCPTPVFALPLPAYSSALKSLVSLCSKLHPTIWSVSSSKEQSMLVYRNEPLFDSKDESDVHFVYKAKCDCSNVRCNNV